MEILTDFLGTMTLGEDGFIKTVSGRSPIREDKFRIFFEKVLKSKLNQLLRGRVTEDELWDEVMKAIRVCFCVNEATMNASKFKTMFYETVKVPIPDILDIYQRILYYPMRPGKNGKMGKGMPDITIVSNIAEDMIPLVRRWHPDFFEIVKNEIWSCKVDQILTDPGFFKFLTMGLEEDADEYLFISRDEKAVSLARDAGIPSVHFQNARQLEKEMTQLGFMFSEKEGELIKVGFSE